MTRNLDRARNHNLVSRLKVERLGGHAHITVYVRGGNSGRIVVDMDDMPEIIGRLCGPETEMEETMPQDSTGKFIKEGDRVRFRGKLYTIKAFTGSGGTCGTSQIEMMEPLHTDEVPDEISVDLVEAK